MTIERTAWLAGLWDGEGSVGAAREAPRRAGARTVIRPQIQLSMTHVPTVQRVVDVLAELGCPTTLRMTAPTKRQKPHHKDAAYVNVTRGAHLLVAARALGPLAVTKAEQWSLLEELCAIRVERGRRVGPDWPGYTEREEQIVDQLAGINRRGTGGNGGPADLVGRLA